MYIGLQFINKSYCDSWNTRYQAIQHFLNHFTVKRLYVQSHTRVNIRYGYSWPRINTLRPRQNGRHFADDTFKRIFMENVNISLKFVPKGLINNIPALVQIMAWRRRGDKPLSEPMMVRLPTHICVTRPNWVKKFRYRDHAWVRATLWLCLGPEFVMISVRISYVWPSFTFPIASVSLYI